MIYILENEPTIRLAFFLGILVLCASSEYVFPLTKRKEKRLKQWPINLSISVLNTLCLKVVFPLLAIDVAYYVSNNAIGLFNNFLIDPILVIVLSLFMLDLLIYAQHVMMHRLPLLWRLHRMHHTEIGLDVTTAVRFHPIEIVISMIIKILFVLLFGIPVIAVIIFEILLNGLSLFNHSNILLPRFLEKMLNKIIITPEIHWIHHSVIPKETNSNYGFNLSIWDKIFGTYTAKPTLQYDEMQQGLSEFGHDQSLNLIELLISPFKNYGPRKDMQKTKENNLK